MDVLESYKVLSESITRNAGKKIELLPKMSKGTIAASSENFASSELLWQALAALPVVGGWLQTPQANLVINDSTLPTDNPMLLAAELFAGDTSWRVDYYQNQWRLITLSEKTGNESPASKKCLISDQRWLSDHAGVAALHYKVYWMEDDTRGYTVAHSRLVSIELDGGK